MTTPLSIRRLLSTLLLGLNAWICSATVSAETIRVVTEELPPFNMTLNGEITGLSTEVVRAVFDHLGLQADIQSLPWARAYDVALHGENVLIYSITRTPQRDPLFKWVGSIAPTHWYLFALSGRPLTLGSLEDAHAYQIATVKEDVGEQYLIAHGFAVGRELQPSYRYELDFEKLKQGHVDLWIANELNAHYLVRQGGDDPEVVLRRVLALPDLGGDDGLNMAFGPNTPDALVERFREGLSAIRANGTYEAILRRWM